MRRASVWLLLSTLLVAAPAAADVSPPRPAAAAAEVAPPRSAPAPITTSEPSTKPVATKRPFVARPMFLGILAALFLILGGVAGAYEKKRRASRP